ncbi:MAG TPA: hypothetical protein DEG17_17860 [Cyanobacteria bacterium UBA11149]|nr:hypothetical protein [Cyanobacteria bacterium UBA11367]HBE61150.1 hypothetical protein [Cyanobacteria bacterium UBA11366]HBK62636.1 hypothetical protein [Cyanobacteria bacterium UBA11166]HBR76704.1 hypothetical protein [Cyanobacteria bacterium UBA11159]HBS72361.1 hypothetical protein [Cyanobacteria bacterium UBA11153]HBW90686.1 hypothetical protein [Cyanobacteria bacterium UBA11149]HCA98250.1 hypothetical protein [Cyanobacteria bacterium UBA9226]
MPTELCLSFATVPILLGILSMAAISSCLQEAGVKSEEIFRGVRLPVIPFPDSGNGIERLTP